MKAIGCQIKCKCGGVVDQLPEDGVWYTLTEDYHIIFRGICSDCGQGVQVQREIQTLFMICPSAEHARLN